MADLIFVGTPVELKVECRDARTGQLKDPTTLEITIKLPIGAKLVKTYSADPEVVKTPGLVGTFTWVYVTTLAGQHAWSALAAGALVGPGDGGIFVVKALSTA